MKITTKLGEMAGQISDASGVSGMLIKSFDNNFVFRVTTEDGSHKDFKIRHDDLSITIDADELAAFYEFEDGSAVLDHSPEVLGLDKV